MSAEEVEQFKSKYQTLEDLPSIGPATINKLKEIGFKTVESLGTATITELVSAGIGEAIATKVIDAARKSIAITFVRGDELVEIRKNIRKLTTGCSSLDQLLMGGIETQSLTEFYGEFGTGKSQLCHQLCVTVQLPEIKGGLDGCVLYIDTEATFRPERMMQIAPRFGIKFMLKPIPPTIRQYSSRMLMKLSKRTTLNSSSSIV
jgi:DNA repair protein RadA